jgi:hypothetical protein
MARAADRLRVLKTVRGGGVAVVYFQNNLGGEISLSPTDKSPELSFDITFVQILERDGIVTLGRYGIFEVQTMDFHGSYKSVVNNLNDALRLHSENFHRTIAANPQWLAEKIEGPNIANVFKRTFYQIVLKFQIGADETCAGCVLALPAAVWDSWQRHLGRPELASQDDGTWRLQGTTPPGHVPAWIYVFDIDQTSSATPNQMKLTRVIATDAEALIHSALRAAPAAAVAGVGSADRVLVSIRQRLGRWWPELRPPRTPRIRLKSGVNGR